MSISYSGQGLSDGSGETEVGIIFDDAEENDQPSEAQISLDDLTPTAAPEQFNPDISMEEITTPRIESLEIPIELTETSIEPLPGVTSSINTEAITSANAKWSGITAAGGAVGGTTSFFGLRAKGTKFVYVVDYSGSMNGDKLRAAKSELLRSVQSMKSEMQFYIIFYDNYFQTMPANNLVHATRNNKIKFGNWAETIRGGGGTNPSGAMRKAIELKPDAIWLLSDGQFNQDVANNVVRMNSGKKIQIHTIAFHDNSGENQLRLIAEQCRGKYRFVSGSKAADELGHPFSSFYNDLMK